MGPWLKAFQPVSLPSLIEGDEQILSPAIPITKTRMKTWSLFMTWRTMESLIKGSMTVILTKRVCLRRMVTYQTMLLTDVALQLYPEPLPTLVFSAVEAFTQSDPPG
jgi:hypothetical protein